MSEKKLKPKMRFNGLSENWVQHKIKDLIQIVPFKAYLKEPEKNGKYEVIQQGNDPIIGYANGNPCEDFENTVVFGDHTLSLYKPKNPFFVATDGVRIVKGLDSMNGNYLMYLLERNKPQSEGYKRHFNIFSDIDVFFTPNREEQTQIGEFFDKTDRLIKQSEEKVEEWKDIRTSLLSKMFPKEGEKVPELRFKGFTGEWEYIKIGDMVDFLNGHDLSWRDINKKGKYECVLYGNLYTDYGMIIYDEIKYKTNKELKSPTYSRYGDVLVPSSSTTLTGVAQATSIEKDGVILGGGINILRPHKDFNGSYLSLLMNSYKKELLKLVKGITIGHIYNNDIKNIVLPISKDINEQIMIVNLFKKVDKQITLHKYKCEKLQNIKTTFLNNMFV